MRGLNESELEAQLKQQLSDEHVSRVTRLEGDLFNDTYRVDCQNSIYILKVAPHEEDVFYNERRLMRRERTLSARLRSVSDLIPEYVSFFTIDGRDAFLQAYVEGRLWQDELSRLSESENTMLWQQLGGFAAGLHANTGEAFGYPEPLESFDKWSDFIVDNVQGMVADCRRFGVYCDEMAQYLQLLFAFKDALDQVDVPALCHGDLWPRNVIIDGDGEDIHIAAVIDAERAYWGDPVSDWVLILYGVPEAFWKGYGENLPRTTDPLRIALYKGMYFILNILETTRTGDPLARPVGWLTDINTELERL